MLSKSKYIKGLQCEKRLWLDKHQPQLKDPISANQEALFAQGSDVGELAQQLFPNGKDATPDYSRRDGIAIGLAQTKQWITEGADVIYEAAVSAGGVYAAMDILIREGDRWRAIEVKSSTGVKDYHINDAAIQYYVFQQAGIDLVDIELMYINNEYTRDGDLELDKLFTRESLLDQVLPLQAGIPDRIAAMAKVLRQAEAPERNIGPHCHDPFACDFIGHCWAHVPQPNVLDIARIGSKGWDLMDQGIMAFDEIPADAPLNDKQWNQVNGHNTGAEVWDKPAIQSFLSEWEYPLYFFDFETIGPAVPLFDDTRPYQQYPFQYSLHIIREPGAEVEHKEYLADPSAGDPRPMLMVNMIKDLGTIGSIVTYNMGFEKGKIRDLAITYGEYAQYLMPIIDRIVDLIIPFRSHWCYLPAMKGSASIKAVLPALTNLSYDDLEIKEGGTASNTWQAMAEGKFEGDQATTMHALREYCKLDTWAMVEVWRVLGERCGK
jgi:hypothetical protein